MLLLTSIHSLQREVRTSASSQNLHVAICNMGATLGVTFQVTTAVSINKTAFLDGHHVDR